MRPTYIIALTGLLAAPSALLATTAFAADNKNEIPQWSVDKPDYSAEATPFTLEVNEGTWMSVDVSPDGMHIVFDLMGDLYQLPISGGEAKSLTSGHAWDMQPRFSPDGKSIAFTSDRAGGDNIWTLNLEDGSTQQITYETFRLLNNPSWSPDGHYIAASKH